MSEFIELDQVDLMFLKNIDHNKFPLQIVNNNKNLKPLEEIIKDEE